MMRQFIKTSDIPAFLPRCTVGLIFFIEKGFWTLAHEYRTDFAMTMLLLFLLLYGAGKN